MTKYILLASSFVIWLAPAHAQDLGTAVAPELVPDEEPATAQGQGQSPESQRPVAVLPLDASRVDEEIADIVSGLILQAADDSCRFSIFGTEDLETMVNFEVLSQAAGCDDVFCLAEIGGALGVAFILKPTLTRLGEELILALTLIDQREQTVVAREQKRMKNDESMLADAVVATVTQLIDEAGLGVLPDSPAAPAAPATTDIDAAPAAAVVAPAAPPQPLTAAEREAVAQRRSTLGIAAWSLLGGAGALIIGGGVVMGIRPGLGAIETNEYATYLAAQTPSTAEAAYADVRSAVDQHNTMTTVGWVLFGAGAASAIASVILLAIRPSAPEVSVTVTPTPNGGALLVGGSF